MNSKIPQFKVVCEGPADYNVIEAALVAILNGEDFVLQRIQPLESLYAGDAGPHGGGWKGVRSWCQKVQSDWGSLAKAQTGISGDILIIHIDADVAHEEEVNCAEACPPAHKTADNLRSKLLQWLGDTKLPGWVVLCVPSKDTDAWVLTAIYPNDEWVRTEIECRLGPAERLLNKPEKLVRRRENRFQKNSHAYRGISNRLTTAWSNIKKRCAEANRFDEDIRESYSLLSRTDTPK